jgi:outer membrane lipoprotein SlyB
MNCTKATCILVAAAGLGLAGCTTPSEPSRTAYPGGPAYPTAPVQDVARYGYVESVETVTPERREGIGVGAIGGAIAGGAIGSQIGSGSGRTAATIGGAVVGGVVGHQVEQHVRGNQAVAVEYVFRVRMDDGSYQTFRKETHDNIRVGDRVRVERGNLFAT